MMNHSHTSTVHSARTHGRARLRLLFIIATALSVCAVLIAIIVVRQRGSHRAPAVQHETLSVSPPAAANDVASRSHATASTDTPPDASELAAHLTEDTAAFRAQLVAYTSRFDRLSGAQAAALLAETPKLAARIDLAGRIANACRDYVPGSWFLSNVFHHAITQGSVTDVFRAGWYWGNFAVSHEEYETAVALYTRTLDRVGEPPGIPYGSYALLLERLAFTHYLCNDYSASRELAGRLFTYLRDDGIPLPDASRGYAAVTCLACMLNTRQIGEARIMAAEIRDRHPGWLSCPGLHEIVENVLGESPSDDPIMLLPPALK